MNELTVGELKQRLERVERQYTRLKLAGGALLMVIIGAVVTGQTVAKIRTVEAEQLIVKDSRGNTRAALGVGVILAEGPDSVGLRLFGQDGTTRLQLLLRAGDDAPFVQLRDREEKNSAQIDLSRDDVPGFGLWGPRRGLGAPRSEINFSFKQDGVPFITLTDKNDKVIWRAP